MEKQQLISFVFLYVCQTVFGDVTVRQLNDSTSIDTFSDAAAGFGPTLPDDGITGFIYNVMPRKACEQVEPPPDNTSVWIALISRDNCTFASKVRNVEKWYAAAIIYNTQGDSIRHMPGDGTPVHIPSVFVGEMDGKLLERNYCYNCRSEQGEFIITIDSNNEYIFNPYLLWPFAVVVGTCFVLMLVFIFVKWCRDVRRRKKSRLPSKHLKKIPTKKFKKGDEYDCCAICLDDYEEGDKLRLLPCSHVYHTKCIDPWLTKNKRSCPICKRKVIPGDDPSSGSSDEGEGGHSERTPLLGGSSRGNNNNTRRSTFDNSGLPAMHSAQAGTSSSEGQGHTGRDSGSDQSDSEVGAVGGVTRVKLSKENLMKTLRVPSSATTETETQESANVSSSRDEQVTIETSQGSDNHGFVVEGEDEESEDEEGEYTFPDSDVVFSEANKKDEKKFNGVV